VASGVRDPESGLLNQAYFDAALPNRVATARRLLHPLTLVVLAVEGVAPARVATALVTALRESDTACRLDDGRYALILEDTPEDGARLTVDRIRSMLTSAVVTAGVASYPAQALEVDELLQLATA
jgi:GGDEF domain-containing protein